MRFSKALFEPPVGRAFPLALIIALAMALPTQAKEGLSGSIAAHALPMVAVEGRDFVVLSSRTNAADVLENAPERFVAQSFVAGSQRIHVVTFAGETYRAATPLDGPRSWIAFDPDRRVFASLLPSIRIELEPNTQIGVIASEIGATSVTEFESLGFAIVELPGHVHPADAVAQVRGLPGRPDASVRLRGPRIEWR